jgi:hypothetical protein
MSTVDNNFIFVSACLLSLIEEEKKKEVKSIALTHSKA